VAFVAGFLRLNLAMLLGPLLIYATLADRSSIGARWGSPRDASSHCARIE